MLIVENISVNYKSKQIADEVIKDLSFEIQTGEALAVLGPSGCGKSTLINALAGTLTTDSGKLYFIKEGQKKTLNPKAQIIGLIPQNCGLLPWKTVKENCLLSLRIRGEQIGEERKKEFTNIYEALGISDILDKYPRELSGGQVQRAAIARAFIQKPDLLLMDEPFSALDAITREEARELFLRVWQQSRPTTVLVTHSIDEALYLGNTVFVMGTNGNIKYSLQNPYFGTMYPDKAEYLVTKQKLREELKTHRDSENN